MTQNFHIINLGCKVNRVEADSMAARLLAAGANQSSLAEADVVLINTCTVTGEADAKSRKAAHRALKSAQKATVIVCGCGAQANSVQFEREENRHCIIADRKAALSRAGEVLGLKDPNSIKTVVRVGESFGTRVAIKIQDGCDHACSYCIVPFARGPSRSLPYAQVLEEIDAHVKAGVKEIVLTGIDLGCYQEGPHGLVHLLTNALQAGEGYRFRLSSIELPSISDELVHLMANSHGRVCAHLHIPLQSGSDRILKAMARRYDVAAFRSRVDEIKKVLKHIAISTDVIVGFPGETESDFCETLSFCREIGFSRTHIFRYSKRPGTRAADMPGHLKAEELMKRANRLRETAEDISAKDALSRIGRSEQVLFESSKHGRSESYYPVRLAATNTLEEATESRKAVCGNVKRGNLVTMMIVGYEQGELIAAECKEL